MKIYVASSWRNALQSTVVTVLREHGFEVYDFKNPSEGNHGFRWVDTGIHNGPIHIDRLQRALQTPIAQDGFKQDHAAMQWADICLLVLPAGRSAHLETGWFMGQGKPVIVYAVDEVEPELMYLLGNDTVLYKDFHIVLSHLRFLVRASDANAHDQDWDRAAEHLTAKALGTNQGYINMQAKSVDDIFFDVCAKCKNPQYCAQRGSCIDRDASQVKP